MTKPNYSADYTRRIGNTEHLARLDLWRLFEDRPTGWIDDLLKELGHAVSHGYFGLAAEISDLLAMTATDELSNPPSRLIQYESERMKRLVYMGYINLAHASACNVEALVNQWRGELNAAEAALWQRTALGYQGWTCSDPDRLKELVAACQQLQGKIPGGRPITLEARAFLQGLRGRTHTLRGASKETRAAFQKGISLLTPFENPRALGHMQVLYAEHLGMLGDWPAAVVEMSKFLDMAFKVQLRSHLLIRAVRFLLFSAPREQLANDERKQLEFRWRLLVDGMGVSQSRAVVPFISNTVSDLSGGVQWDILTIDTRAELTRWLRTLDAEGMEALIAAVYRHLGYEVHQLAIATPVLDLIATVNNKDGTRAAVGIQVKHWLSGAVQKDDIPDETQFQKIKLHIQSQLDCVVPTGLHWYCSSSMSVHADELLRNRARTCFGDGCQVRTTKLDDLVTLMVSRHELLREVPLKVHADRLFGAEWKSNR